ncbi:MAG TPA: YciI family protein [Gaiellaceae bacterium]|nr:YciI family protein [Gaiellaceae bacterium]
MEYFVYCRDRPGTRAVRERLTEAHWSFMDAYAERMIARGPTLTEDGETATGSMHIVDLPDAEAARAFAFEEPNYRAGVYGEVMIRRWRNLLGRTMWEYRGGPEGGPRYLVIAHGGPRQTTTDPAELTAEDRVIVFGPLLSDDGTGSVGAALAVEAPSRDAVEAMLTAGPLAGLFDRIEIHRWEFGGRR